MSSLNVGIPALAAGAAVGGAGTAGTDSTVNGPAMGWALQEDAITDAVTALEAAEAATPALAERLERIHRAGLGLSPEESGKRLRALRTGATEATTRLEREYVAAFEPLRVVRARIAAALAGRDVSAGPAVPTAAELASGRRLPASAVAALLTLEVGVVVTASTAILAALEAARAHSDLLADVYDGLDVSPAAAKGKLRTLALAGEDALGGTPMPAERAYAGHFAPLRDFRVAAAKALACPTPKVTEGSAACSTARTLSGADQALLALAARMMKKADHMYCVLQDSGRYVRRVATFRGACNYGQRQGIRTRRRRDTLITIAPVPPLACRQVDVASNGAAQDAVG